ncbi:hypothetical protein C8P63_11191 [Melghirimyces profundicolus]|uniref:Uncharacterized protein n=1 Tax=Melghirimyces profundicolus TaxID=1242148 RepID=A0A2T6BUE4_9BACL|nr:DUF5132 domain-containing protein [Melghirimyces profundicolus]PTX59656.1 hypothetical protein C8P63_11191 [Melghirimyces profundicolus]
MKSLDRWLAGAALLAAAPTLFPVAVKTVKPLAQWANHRMKAAGRQTQSTWYWLKEEVEDIVAEAQFERMKNRMEKELF